MGILTQQSQHSYPYGQTLTPNPSHIGEGSKCAFTLAETLITLVIIGIVAALTVPTLITKYQKEQTVTRFKKVYSTLSQAINKSIADNGPISSWLDSSYTGTSDDFIDKYFRPYLNITKDCRSGNNKGKNDCDFTFYNQVGSKRDGVQQYGKPKIILGDGTRIGFMFSNTASDKFMYIVTDINGKKGPNKYGRDVFSL